MEIDVSFVMSVYNKEYYLPHVLKALINQTGVKNPEFIFVDDVSSDKSIDIIKDMTKGLNNVTLKINEKNMGISPTVNKAIMLAKGKWVRMLDSDDIFPLDSTEKMIELAEKHNADIVYGNFKKTGKKAEELTNIYMDKDFDYKYSGDTLMTILNGRFTRMGQLIKREVLHKAKGADERVFIQDETIPLRVGIHGSGVIKIHSEVVLVPEEIGNFSGNKTQLNADRFLAYYHTIKDNQNLPPKALKRMYQKAVSAYWKEVKTTAKLPYFTGAFWNYLENKMFRQKPNIKYLEKMKKYFDKKTNFRRTANYT
ncbi:MAG: glycosyltransferase family 2 protein [Lactobacillaceae bacterium]|jgi:glycosyltransferase involved in cell wall biosynthesis|nr:glycosyltransferase family 2 protein [Lactobacillaceae bacterium]